MSSLSPRRRSLSLRSILIGTLLVASVCLLTPYNDYVINNSFLTGNFFPPALVLGIIGVVVANACLHRWWPRRALTGGEVATIVAMLLVACSVPGQGLMRNLVPLPVTFFYQGRSDETLWRVFTSLGLPAWLFAVPDVASGRGAETVSDFYGRTPDGQAMPWQAWIVPLATWGAFIACLYAALLSMAALVRGQWEANERLPFPLAQVGAMLIEPPAVSRAFNRIFSDPMFRIVAGSVFALQSLVALHRYLPAYFPDLSFTFDLTRTLADNPWAHLVPQVKRATLYFTFVGVAYFIQSRVGFSLWAIFLIEQFTAMGLRNVGRDVPNGVWDDQHLGACAMFIVCTLWIGRRHWMTVLRQAIGMGGPIAGETNHAGWARLLLAAIVGMFVWLTAVGVGPIVALAIVALLLGVHFIVARVVAETGLPFVRVTPTIPQIASNFSPSLMTGKEMFFAGSASLLGPIASRESLLPNALHGLLIAGKSTESDDRHAPASQRSIVAVMAWALLVAFVVSAASSLWCYYTYAWPLNANAMTMENSQGAIDVPRNFIASNIVDQAAGRFEPKPYNAPLQIGIGAGITGGLQVAALRYASWPFMPVAYLVSHTWYLRLAWWSLLVGWLCKVLILRYGGASMYQRLKPAFVGLIVGEALATGFWLIVALIRVWSGMTYQVVNFLPQ